ncbi:MAG: T9SS type A sorting domain-containing protein, partial [candidate division Zixibacteria bacterium]|nr:T9SS type A sorting domain-containing protein [candidate division Zixibacteria bacterium]
CFPADTSGHYELTVVAASDCGADTCTFTVDATINSSPVADDPGSAVDTFMCAAAQICYQFSASDVDGGALTWSRLSGAGSVDANGNWCFDANASGTYSVVAAVEDSCNVADTVSKTYNVTLNSSPTLALDNDTSLFLCAPVDVCLDYTVSDPDTNIATEELLGGVATLDTAVNTLCFVPDTAGTYQFIVGVTDECNASDVDTVDIVIDLNEPPVVDAGEDIAEFNCEASEICFDVTFSDSNDNLDTCYLVIGPGSVNSNNVCFTPDTAGVYSFVVRAIDECDASDEDTVLVTVTLNSPPVCELPNDTAFFQCAPSEVTLPVGASDVDGNFNYCEIVSGAGSIVDGFWTHIPTTDEVDTIVVKCLDSCQTYCEGTFVVTFNINDSPIVDAGDDTSYFFCESGSTICWPVSSSDPNNNLVSCSLLTENGTYDSNNEEICFTVPPGDRPYVFVMEAVDSCSVKYYDTATINITINDAPTIQMDDSLTVFHTQQGNVCFDAEIFDVDGNLDSVDVSSNAEYVEGSGICFQADTAGWYSFEVYAVDSCGAWTTDSVFVEINIDECLHVQAEKVHNAYQGQHTLMNIYLNGTGKPLGGFDLLLTYDESALMPGVVTPGQLFENCGWEYFAYRYGDIGNCGNACPSGLLRIVGIAETNNGANHPGCFMQGMTGVLASVDFLVSNDRTFNCMYVPVSFYWADCADNSFSSQSGDTLWVSRSIYDFELNPIHDYSYGVPGYFGVHDSCLTGGGEGKPAPQRCVDFTNGGIDIICADSVDARGDMNLNGIVYEVADAVVYANYFVFGISALTVNLEGQTAASDVNSDGLPLTVGDMVYLIRVLVGDAPPVPKLDPNAVFEAEFSVDGDVVSVTNTDRKIGAIFMIVKGQTEPTLHENASTSNMDLRYHYDGTSTRVLIYNMKGDSYLESGPIIQLNGSHTINRVEVGSYNGLNMTGKITNLPTCFWLHQCYPNPFNPTTTIEFGLPVNSEWNLTVYDILGHEVQEWNGKSEAGIKQIEWDASKYASGVYFYRLKAGDFTASKKMVLIK